MRFIINADDCGYSKGVNEAIERCFVDGLLTSTTVMVNMNDLDGAVRLYKDWGHIKSFGIHLNLSEGSPLLYNQFLLDHGFYVEDKGEIQFNKVLIKNRFLQKNVRCELYKELRAQFERIYDVGISPSHIDGHHHIHTSPFILPIVMNLAKDFQINKIRRVRLTPDMKGHDIFVRKLWKYYAYLFNTSVKTVDYFSCYQDYVHNSFNLNNNVWELMIHPGDEHPEDEFYIKNNFPFVSEQLISYHDI